MTEIISFEVTGPYASFRDPSITSNQSVYYIPSKTAIVGLLGAIIGIKRDNNLGDLYQEEYLEFFSKVQVGLKVEGNPKKIIYFTNYRSLNPNKNEMKPVKKEILEKPRYRFFVSADNDILQKISVAIKTNTYSFSPYLGHAYCPAEIRDFKNYNAEPIENVSDKQTDCVILDESDSNFNDRFDIELDTSDDAILVVERHLHHFFQAGTLKSKVLKHWIPLDSTLCKIEELQHPTLSRFYQIDDKVYCLY